MSKRRVPLKDNPDQPHAYQPRKITNRGEPWPYWWAPERGRADEYARPCRHCGGSESLPVHSMERGAA